MKIASITETKNRLRALLDRVRHGETILILDSRPPKTRKGASVLQALMAERAEGR